MESLYLIKVGEIALKGQNRSYFEGKLRDNIRRNLRGIRPIVRGGDGRFFLTAEEEDETRVVDALSKTFGVTGFSRTLRVEKDMEAIVRGALSLVDERQAGSFKIEARRSDKSFPRSSYEIASEVGRELLAARPELRVDVRAPDWILNVEIRDRAFLYIERNQGPGGLPVGCAGRGVLLLSGGIDSPVAGYLMAKRGLRLDACYFHAYPYTSESVEEKVKRLCEILAPYLGGVNLFVVPFTETQERLKELAKDEEVTLLMRACMMKIASALAERRQAGCLVTGESLSQVASQTTEAIRFTGSVTDLPVFRPLIGMDKEEIIAIARRTGTFATSVLPYDDCCSLFAPKHPLIRPDFARMRESYGRLAIDECLARALERAERSFSGPEPRLARR